MRCSGEDCHSSSIRRVHPVVSQAPTPTVRMSATISAQINTIAMSIRCTVQSILIMSICDGFFPCSSVGSACCSTGVGLKHG